MIEHRLIERMIEVIKAKISEIEKTREVDSLFIDTAVDFIRTYADQTHHGKEEDILFRDLRDKDLNPDHERILNDLIEEHKYARQTTGALVDAKERYVAGDEKAIQDVLEKMKVLVEFYPGHIEKEDKHFFLPVMEYFSQAEKDALLEEGRAFDRRMIHRKYESVLWEEEQAVGTAAKERDLKWLDYI